MNIIFNGQGTDVHDRFRKQATAKLSRIEKLDQKAIRVHVEVSTERNPRQSGRRERVELTISSRGPAIRAEASAEDRYAALDMAFSKLESRLRRAGDRRKCRHGGHSAVRVTDLPAAKDPAAGLPSVPGQRAPEAEEAAGDVGPADDEGDVVPIEMQGNGPLVVREKFHLARPMAIDEALLEMELVGHDFFLFRDTEDGRPSVVYKRRGYQYGVIRLVEEVAEGEIGQPSQGAGLGRDNGRAEKAAQFVAR
ncbi:MAG TPA: ribosome-associated translation inhibitor RaiA [Streptosporangiaceae bacterium]|nr:ribosome-associated translation inhibitor RaiA [Streptosporangiaceae bacterium]